jgi:CheY-like chemotaxis protein
VDAPRSARVLIVDDNDDLRTLLRLVFSDVEGFEVVGEAANGADAVTMATELHPDVVILDRDMPVLSGVEALPALRRAVPAAAVVLFTAAADDVTRRVALGAGADEVWEKASVPVDSMARELTRVYLARHEELADSLEVAVGPVPSAAARVWIPNTRAIVTAVRDHGVDVGLDVPVDVADVFLAFLDEWESVAEDQDQFFWAASASVDVAERLLEYWAHIDSMTSDQLASLEVSWSPPEGQVFFIALTTAMLEGLATREDQAGLAARLHAQWVLG